MSMKISIAALCLLASISTFGQLTVYEKFQKINTMEQAQQYIAANPELKPTILNLTAGKDTTLIDKRLLRQKKGDVFSVKPSPLSNDITLMFPVDFLRIVLIKTALAMYSIISTMICAVDFSSSVVSY